MKDNNLDIFLDSFADTSKKHNVYLTKKTQTNLKKTLLEIFENNNLNNNARINKETVEFLGKEVVSILQKKYRDLFKSTLCMVDIGLLGMIISPLLDWLLILPLMIYCKNYFPMYLSPLSYFLIISNSIVWGIFSLSMTFAFNPSLQLRFPRICELLSMDLIMECSPTKKQFEQAFRNSSIFNELLHRQLREKDIFSLKELDSLAKEWNNLKLAFAKLVPDLQLTVRNFNNAQKLDNKFLYKFIKFVNKSDSNKIDTQSIYKLLYENGFLEDKFLHKRLTWFIKNSAEIEELYKEEFDDTKHKVLENMFQAANPHITVLPKPMYAHIASYVDIVTFGRMTQTCQAASKY